mmetsp:Transcript_24764/g.68480  ORF Transcript_24764/g.68480 Transcript_24764/m.68480 type:complete len:100 (-) Transcript_24764:1188-1487(-)
MLRDSTVNVSAFFSAVETSGNEGEQNAHKKENPSQAKEEPRMAIDASWGSYLSNTVSGELCYGIGWIDDIRVAPDSGGTHSGYHGFGVDSLGTNFAKKK